MEEKFIYEFTKNKKFLRQYHRLRKIIYNIDLGIDIPEYSDYFDLISDTMVVRNKQKCIGGVRLTVCEPMSDTILPTESEEFRLKNLLPELNLEYNTYAEFSKLFVLPEYRNHKVTDRIYKHLNRRAKQLGVRYIFANASRRHARLYVREYIKFGFKVEVLTDIAIPDSVNERYNGTVDCLIMLDLTPKYSMPFIDKTENLVELSMV